MNQTLQALAKANAIRTARARTRKQIRKGLVSAQAIIYDPPEEMQTASISYVLISVRRAGVVHVNKVCNNIGINPYKKLCDLTPRQKRELVQSMADWKVFR